MEESEIEMFLLPNLDGVLYIETSLEEEEHNSEFYEEKEEQFGVPLGQEEVMDSFEEVLRNNMMGESLTTINKAHSKSKSPNPYIQDKALNSNGHPITENNPYL